MSKPQTPGRVLIDDDDSSYEGMKLPYGWEFISGPRAPTSFRLNDGYNLFRNEPFYGQIGDDYVCKPIGWDTQLAESCGHYKISWGNDGRWGEKLCTSFFIGGELVRMFDFMAHPELDHLYVDSLWWMIAKGSGLARYRADIETKHINIKDKTYQERRLANDHKNFMRLRADGEIDRLIDLAADFNR